MNTSSPRPLLPLDHATITVGGHTPVNFPVAGGKWQEFLKAAAALGEMPEKLLCDAVDFCADTTISTADYVARGMELQD
jgi:hypothetical protein